MENTETELILLHDTWRNFDIQEVWRYNIEELQNGSIMQIYNMEPIEIDIIEAVIRRNKINKTLYHLPEKCFF